MKHPLMPVLCFLPALGMILLEENIVWLRIMAITYWVMTVLLIIGIREGFFATKDPK